MRFNGLKKSRLSLLALSASAFVASSMSVPAVMAEDARAPATIIRLDEKRVGACDSSAEEAVLEVSIIGLQTLEGRVRAQIYSSDPDEFLEKGMKLVRVDMPIDGEEEPRLCVPLPTPGTYALVVLHDKNENGKADIFSEGFGFSNNPKLSLGPPDADEVMFTALAGVSKHDITLSYVFGGDEEKKEKRRKLRRR